MKGGGAKVVAQQSWRWAMLRLADGIGASVANLLDAEDPLGELRVVRDANASLATRHGHAHLETERANITQRAHSFTVPTPTVHVCAVFDDLEVVTARHAHDAVHVSHRAVGVHRDDRFRALGERRLDGSRVDTQGVRLDVHKYRHGANMSHCENNGAPGEQKDEHNITRSDSQGGERALQ